jgi:NADH-quinone oxidoreductase subunit A
MNAQNIIISTPVVFLAFLLLFALLSLYLKRKADKTPSGKHAFDPYACGQNTDAVSQYINPNFKRMFYLAFFFTVMHVLVMIVSTAPKGHTLMPVAYIAVGALAMLILFRK